MAYSIHAHITTIFEVNSKSPNDFSLKGRKPNEIFQFKQKTYGIKIQTEIKFKIHAEWVKEGKTIKMMKRSKNRKGLTQVKAIFFCK